MRPPEREKTLLMENLAEREDRGVVVTNDRGAALVTALLAMLVLSAVGMMITVTVAEDVQIALNHYEMASCLYICEAGLNYAVTKIRDDSSWPGLPSPGRDVAGGNFTVTVSDSTAGGAPLPGGRLRLNVTATHGTTEREIEVIVQ